MMIKLVQNSLDGKSLRIDRPESKTRKSLVEKSKFISYEFHFLGYSACQMI